MSIRIHRPAARLAALLAALVAGATAVACAAAEPPVPGRPAQPAPAATPPAADAVPGEVPAELIERLRADLRTRLAAAAPERIEVVSQEARDWPDGSLGCPKRGEYYPQLVLPGYRVVLRAGARSYDYHATRAGHFVLCERPRRGPIAPNVRGL